MYAPSGYGEWARDVERRLWWRRFWLRLGLKGLADNVWNR